MPVELTAGTGAIGAIDPLETPQPRIDPPVARRPADAVLDERVRAGRQWRIDTPRGPVHVWIPADYDPATAAAVVFVHGYWTEIDDAWGAYRLPEQFALSGINAMFIAPDAPATKWDAIAWPSLGDLVAAVAERIDVAMPACRLVAVGHSGAYRTLALWLAEPRLDSVVLLDAVYTEWGLLPWVRASLDRRLINIVYETGLYSNDLHARLPSTVRIRGLPHDSLPDARIVYVRTWVGHWGLVTDGVALPLSLRALGIARSPSAPLDLPLGLPLHDDPHGAAAWQPPSPFGPRILELAP